MSDSSFTHTSISSSISSAPSRPQKLGSVQSIVKDESDKKNPSPFEEITLSDDEEIFVKPVKCPTCSRDMTIWSNSRRDIHTKVCRTKKAEKERTDTKKRSQTLTNTIEQDDKVLEKASPESRDSQKSWEFSKNNVKFARIAADDEENRKRKRPRSFAIVELAPKKCQCEVLTTLHSRFIEEFHCKSVKKKNKKEEIMTEHAFQMKKIISKLTRFEQLSVDMQKVLDDKNAVSPFVIKFECTDGSNLNSQALILKHRTSIIKIHPKTETIRVDQTETVLRAWLTFVFTANIEWSENEKEGVRELAKKYGPVGLDDFIDDKYAPEKEFVKGENDLDVSQAADPKELATIHSKNVCEKDEIETEREIERNDLEKSEDPINYFTTDDPYFGFGTVLDAEEDFGEKVVVLENHSQDTEDPTPQTLRDNITMDSFDEWSNQPFSSIPSTSSPVSVATPVRNAAKPVFGSHVKVLKTTDITPMPQFETMDETELKERMKEIGMRPKGKKTMIQILKKAYITLHPEICAGTPTIRPLIKTGKEGCPEDNSGKEGRVGIRKTKTLSDRMAVSPKKTIAKKTTPKKSMDFMNDNEEDGVDADKTLNISNDERETGNICGDDVGDDEDEEETTGSSDDGQSNIIALRTLFLTWIRQKQNSVLHGHVLSLQPVSLEEMLIRLEKAEGPLGRIGKSKLVKVLEMLKITYQLPQTAQKARGGFKRRF